MEDDSDNESNDSLDDNDEDTVEEKMNEGEIEEDAHDYDR